MGVTKKNIGFSNTHIDRMEKTRKALQTVSKDIIAETKALNTYMVVSDGKGGVKKIWAKDL